MHGLEHDITSECGSPEVFHELGVGEETVGVFFCILSSFCSVCWEGNVSWIEEIAEGSACIVADGAWSCEWEAGFRGCFSVLWGCDDGGECDWVRHVEIH